jgi:hypothetical protein
MMGAIFRNLRPLLVLQPDLASALAARQFSSLLVGFGFLSVLHLCQKTVGAEKASGMMDTLLSTPLTLSQMIWGKALYLGLLGYSMGLLLMLLNLAVLSYTLGDVGVVTSAPAYCWVFAFVVAPATIVGILVLVVAASLLVSDTRVVVLPFTLLVAALIGVGSWSPSTWTDKGVVVALALLGVGCHLLWWLVGGRISREQVLSR